jgi:hypothetical protein
MTRFDLTLKNEKARSYRLISRFIILLNVIGIIYFLATRPVSFKTAFTPVIVLVASFFYFAFIVTEIIAKKPSYDTLHRTILALCMFSWVGNGLWWIGFLDMLFILLDSLAFRTLHVIVTDRYIQLPSFPKKMVQWKELHNAVLKDGIITFDFKNNKLFQHPVLHSDWDIEEEVFNQFCQQCLAASDK